MEPAEIKNKIEAVLFSTGKKVNIDYIAKLCRANKEDVLKALQELRADYESKGASLLVAEEGDFWKLTVREAYSPIVRKIVPDAELTKTMIETLAVVAWKAPVLQSDVIRLRTNKAYDHIAEIEDAGFISREKHGRTQLIKLTQRFYDYFDVHSEADIKDRFKGFKEAVEKKAKEAEPVQEGQQEQQQPEHQQEQEQPEHPQQEQPQQQQQLQEEQKPQQPEQKQNEKNTTPQMPQMQQ